jgi:hypothetical protein
MELSYGSSDKVINFPILITNYVMTLPTESGLILITVCNPTRRLIGFHRVPSAKKRINATQSLKRKAPAPSLYKMFHSNYPPLNFSPPEKQPHHCPLPVCLHSRIPDPSSIRLLKKKNSLAGRRRPNRNIFLCNSPHAISPSPLLSLPGDRVRLDWI